MLSSMAAKRITTQTTLASRQLRQLRPLHASSRHLQENDGGAFDPKSTRPESENAGQVMKEETGDRNQTGTHPNDPAANATRDPKEEGVSGSKRETGGGGSARSGGSGGGSPPKKGGGASGGGGGT